MAWVIMDKTYHDMSKNSVYILVLDIFIMCWLLLLLLLLAICSFVVADNR